MNTFELLGRVKALNVDLMVVDGRLLLRSRGLPLPPDLRLELKMHKEELIQALTVAPLQGTVAVPLAVPAPSIDLPEGWQSAVDAWFRAGCPRGGPLQVGLNFLVLRQLARAPLAERPALLKQYRGLLSAKKTMAVLLTLKLATVQRSPCERIDA